MFRVEMLPAGNGDALWIEYGTPGKFQRVLVDGGTPGSYKYVKERIEKLPPADRRFELLVITHIDADHIGGALALLEKAELGASYGDVWFNGYGHLLDGKVEAFGALQGERLTTALLAPGTKWNDRFGHAAVRRGEDGAPMSRTLDGGLELTLLCPTVEKLAKLRPVWEKECAKAGLDPNQEVIPPEAPPGLEPMGAIDVDALAAAAFVEDAAEANGSSIALLAKYDGKAVLLAADAHPSLLVEAIDRVAGAGRKLALTACKLPHHGSLHNVSRELVERLDCKRYLVSTDGKQFHHPDREAIARVIHFGGPGVELTFNYRSQYNAVWDDDDLRAEYGYRTVYPAAGTSGIAVEL